MSKIEIFEGEYLKAEYLNPQYRGLVGWPCEIVTGVYGYISGNLISCREHYFFVEDCDNCVTIENNFSNEPIRIEQFEPKDIPVGELVLIKYFRTAVWRLEKFAGITNYNPHDYIVPYLIAATPEQAEERKDWCK